MARLRLPAIAVALCGVHLVTSGQSTGPVARFGFDGDLAPAAGARAPVVARGEAEFADGLRGQALRLRPGTSSPVAIDVDALRLGPEVDFSVQVWIRTTADADRRMVLLSQKRVMDNSLASQRRAGWTYYVNGGTWAWQMGSGARRITYERDNGHRMPVNDGQWHQLTMTYDSTLSEVRLYADGASRAIYHVADAAGFDFAAPGPVTVGWEAAGRTLPAVLPAIRTGAEMLQALVDEFDGLGVTPVEPDEFVHLITDPRRLFDQKVEAMAAERGGDRAAFVEAMAAADFTRIAELESELMRNPYTVHQVVDFMTAAPLLQVYALVDGRVTIDDDGAARFAARERLDSPDVEIDELAFWDRALSADEVRAAYAEHATPVGRETGAPITSLTAAAWNIWHGGKHFTVREHGWDSRVAIADMIRDEGIDVVMMQETYSAGDFIAAELGYAFATTVDRDYLNQGSNISVLSRFPITAVHVERDSSFMNVAARLALSDTQELYAMSNWYGMAQFPAVFEFHRGRFAESDTIPTLFAGDFNAVPHTDGGDSPASRVLLDAGFTDAFREAFPDPVADPGPTHRSGRRIDQLYYKGRSLTNRSTRVISTREAGFPSDHFLIVTTFDLASPLPGRW